MLFKKFQPLLLVAILAAALAGCSSNPQSGPTPTPLPPLVNYEAAIYTVEMGPIVSEVKVLGIIAPTKQDDLFFRSSGYVSRVTVKEGDVIKKGDLLAELQIADALSQLQQAKIDLAVAQAGLVKGIVQVKHQTRIAELQAAMAALDATDARGRLNLQIAQENLAMARETEKEMSDPNSYDQQSVTRNQLTVQRLESMIADQQIIAPYDGVVMRTHLRAGQSADAFVAQFTIGDPTTTVVQVARTQELTDSLTKNSDITLHPTIDSEESYKTQYMPAFQVESSSAAGQTATTTDSIYFTVPAEVAGKLIVGHQVQLVVVLGKKDNVLMLPPAAIRNYRGINYVIVMDGEKRRRVDLYSIGLKTPERWEVNGALNEGDKVLGP